MRIAIFDVMDDMIEAYERKGMSHCDAIMAARKQLDGLDGSECESDLFLVKKEQGKEQNKEDVK